MARSGIVGRRSELAGFDGRLAAARGGRGRLVLCTGEPGIGKTRLARAVSDRARASGATVAWGRCPEAGGAPPLWPLRQVLRSLGVDAEALHAGPARSAEDRFRLVADVTDRLRDAADADPGLLVVFDDVHRADEPTLLVLRQLADHLGAMPLLLVVTSRHDRVPALPAAERLQVRGLDVDEVREQLAAMRVDGTRADEVHRVTAGNPLFVREVARAMADGTWCAQRPPRSVLDVIAGRLTALSPACRGLLEVAAVAGLDAQLGLVAAARGSNVAECRPLVDEAVARGLVERVGDSGDHRFVHALTRDAVEASLTTADRIVLHRDVADAIETVFADDLTDWLPDLARHWTLLAPHGAAATARTWLLRAAEQAVEHFGYEEGARLYRVALGLPAALSEVDRSRISVALGRACCLAGDVPGGAAAATAGMAAARAAGRSELMAEAALVVEPALTEHTVNGHTVNAVAERLCDEALHAPGHSGPLRARLLAQRSHLAFYGGRQDRVRELSTKALELARDCADDRALDAALRARQEACTGPAGRAERLRLADEMLDLAGRTGNARTAVWGVVWRIDALTESGRLAAAVDELGPLDDAVRRVGGPVTAWYLDRAAACLAQARGRFDDAITAGRRAFERMRPVEYRAARGSFFALHSALAHHVGPTEAGMDFVRHPFDPPRRFATMVRLHRAFLLLRAGRTDEAGVVHRQTGPPDWWSFPPFLDLYGRIVGMAVAVELGRVDDVAALLNRLRPFRGEHAAGILDAYLGPVDLCVGRGHAALGELDQAVECLGAAVEQAEHAGAPAFAAEARYHLAAALLARNATGDHARARRAATDADTVATALGMTAYVERTAELVARLRRVVVPTQLSAREVEVAELVAAGLTDRQIAQRLAISEHTAENHVRHILAELGFADRREIAVWQVSSRG